MPETVLPGNQFTQPEDGGSIGTWGEPLLNTNWLNANDLFRRLVTLLNVQEPIGTIKSIPSGAAIPLGWELLPNSTGRVLISKPGSLAEDATGGTVAWDTNTDFSTYAGEHSHNTNLGEGGHTHTLSGQNTSDVALVQAHLPAVQVPLDQSSVLYTVDSGEDVQLQIVGSGGLRVKAGPVATQNLGSGAGHGHAQDHTHNGTEGDHTHSTGPVADHRHQSDVTNLYIVGGQWIRKTRDLTYQDAIDQTPAPVS